ncbi:MAG: hypothetical protein AB7T38_09690 [Nitrospirales bacterium]
MRRMLTLVRRAVIFEVAAVMAFVVAIGGAATAQDTSSLVRILERDSGSGLNIETRKVAVSGFQSGWWSAQWWLLPVMAVTGQESSSVYIVNRWMKEYLSVEHGIPTFIRQPSPLQTLDVLDGLSYAWNIEAGDIGNQKGIRPDGTEGDVWGPLNFHIKHRQTGKYLISQNGSPVLSVVRGKPWRISSAHFPSSIPSIPLYKASTPAPAAPAGPASPASPRVNTMSPPSFWEFLPGQRFIRVLEKSSTRGLMANDGAIQTGAVNRSALDNQWVLLVPSSLSPSGHPPNYAGYLVNRWTRANLSVVSGGIALGTSTTPGTGSPWNLNDLWDFEVAETGMQRQPSPLHGGITDVEVPITYHLKHRASGKYLVSVKGKLQSSDVHSEPWRLVEVPIEELQKAQYGPLNTR